ncbi:28S ribosomal protein S18b%2C mitochondrial [Xyrichtys novacula]|uniref:28S ribosomal protein S18b, mitochondrial n=1 Tax=Xyrichtys novacula TaxID=13765 RepID=A0AAV1HC79_XYRNO|nr:28S ribosomal protein S18b%2C mitochondrial [Xyrichtys novacula]
MAASIRGAVKVFCRLSPSLKFSLRQHQRLPVGVPVPGVILPPCRLYCEVDSLVDKDAAEATETLSRYKERPWEYLDSEEYTDRYGSGPVWAGYRRNHKGGIPPQKTRKTCIRGDKVSGNPCPICRDPNVMIHHQVSPHFLVSLHLRVTGTAVCFRSWFCSGVQIPVCLQLSALVMIKTV